MKKLIISLTANAIYERNNVHLNHLNNNSISESGKM